MSNKIQEGKVVKLNPKQIEFIDLLNGIGASLDKAYHKKVLINGRPIHSVVKVMVNSNEWYLFRRMEMRGRVKNFKFVDPGQQIKEPYTEISLDEL